MGVAVIEADYGQVIRNLESAKIGSSIHTRCRFIVTRENRRRSRVEREQQLRTSGS